MPPIPGVSTGTTTRRARWRSRAGTCVNAACSPASSRRATGLLPRDEVDQSAGNDDDLADLDPLEELGDSLVDARRRLVLGLARPRRDLHPRPHLAVDLDRDLDFLDHEVRRAGLGERLVREGLGVPP